jgi:crotonobetainyl-CoA:carnitine CoA-transferase CaiB-like acyl-CoA transferase
MDAIFQALSGLMLMAGAADDPPVRNGVPLGDLTGALFAVIGTLSALLLRERTGRGDHVDVSLLGALTSLAATEPWETMARAGIELRTGNTAPRLAPFGVFPARDGHVALCASTDTFARGVFAAVGRPELAEDDRFATRDLRVANARALHAEIEAWTAGRAAAEAVAALEAHGVPAAIVRSPGEAIRDERVRRRGETTPLVHPTLGRVDDLLGSGLPIRYGRAAAGYDRAAPRLGEHNAFVYGALLGYDGERLARLQADGVL